MSMFAISTEENYDGLSIPSLAPGKYENVTLKGVVFEQLKKASGELGKWAIKFTFLTAEGNEHQHTEYELIPGEQGFDSKLKNSLKRIGHIMTKFMPKESTGITGNTYQEMGNAVVAKFNAVPFKDIKVDILITGNVYNNKATSGFTGYPPFIAKHGETLQFDATGQAANKAYEAFMNKQSGGAATADNDTAGSPNGQINTSQSPKPDF